jgi:hypothetical protein
LKEDPVRIHFQETGNVEDHNEKRITTGAQNTQIQYETRVIREKGLTDSMVPTVTLQRFAGDVSHLGIFGGSEEDTLW